MVAGKPQNAFRRISKENFSLCRVDNLTISTHRINNSSVLPAVPTNLSPHISWVFEQKWFRYPSGQGARRCLSEGIVGTMSKSKIFWQHSTDGYMGHFGRFPMKYAGKNRELIRAEVRFTKASIAFHFISLI